MLSLIIPYRNRPEHLSALLPHLENIDIDDVEFIIVEGAEAPTLNDMIWPNEKFSYIYIQQEKVFHKTQLLNIGLKSCKGEYVMPYDVDLIPVNQAIEVSYKAALNAPQLLLSGYRLMSDSLNYSNGSLSPAPEDLPSSFKKNILSQTHFGISPVFNIERLITIDGWDDNFLGWGAEDQDVIERYCDNHSLFARLPQVYYIHLPHDLVAGWNDHELTIENRKYYNKKRDQIKS